MLSLSQLSKIRLPKNLLDGTPSINSYPILDILDSYNRIRDVELDAASLFYSTSSDLGMKSDFARLTGITTTASSSTITSSSPMFASSDIGKNIVIYGAGTSGEGYLGDELKTTISGYTSTTQVTVSSAATVSVSSALGIKGTDNSPILLAGITANRTIVIEEGNYYFASAMTITGLNGVRIVGLNQRPKLYFISTSVNSYISIPTQARRNLFAIYNCTNTTFDNLYIENVGQTQALVNTAEEDGYWTILNGVSTPYNRTYSKWVNSGIAIYIIECFDTTISNCETLYVGCLQSSSGGLNTNQRMRILNNKVISYCLTAIFPVKTTLVQGNVFDNTAAPILDGNDIGIDAGTSHAVYMANAYDQVIITGNHFIGCRGYAVQWNTSSGISNTGHVVSDNLFVECFAGVSLIGNHPIMNVTFTGNVFHNVGTNLFDHSSAIVTISGNIFNGEYTGTTNPASAILMNNIKSVNITGNTFSNRNDVAQSCGVGLSILQNSSAGEVFISNNQFNSTLSRSINHDLNTTNFTGKIIISGNNFKAPVAISSSSGQISTSADGDKKIFILNNTFHIPTTADSPIATKTGMVIMDNLFLAVDGFWVITADLLSGSSDLQIINNTIRSLGSSTNFLLLTAPGTNNNKVNLQFNKSIGNTGNSLNGHFLKTNVSNVTIV